jgi:chromosome segregation ATPase
MDRWYIDNWQHLMGALDTVLDDARSNAATIPGSHTRIDELLSRAERQRSAAEAALRELAARRQELTETLNEVQRELAVAGVPLRGEIS